MPAGCRSGRGACCRFGRGLRRLTFPSRTDPEILLGAGVSAIVQPGGSVRDDDVTAAVQGAGATMYFTGARHFYH